jgi:hypothetical protein
MPTTTASGLSTISSEILRGESIPDAEAAAMLSVARRAVRDLIVRGVVVNGTRIKLEGRKVGGRWRTSKAAVERFLERQDALMGGE